MDQSSDNERGRVPSGLADIVLGRWNVRSGRCP